MTDSSIGYLYQGPDWDFSVLQRVYEACEHIACSELGLELYPNQIEVITAEQMLDAYASIGMPLFYKHWSFGKHFIGCSQVADELSQLIGLHNALFVVMNDECLALFAVEPLTPQFHHVVKRTSLEFGVFRCLVLGWNKDHEPLHGY